MFPTPKNLRTLVQDVTIWVSIILIALGMIMSITNHPTALDTLLVIGGIAFFGGGWGLSCVLPQLNDRRFVVCPYCGKMVHVHEESTRFTCAKCNHSVKIKSKSHKGRRAMLTLISSEPVSFELDGKHRETLKNQTG